MVFFCSGANQVQKFFPLIFRPSGHTDKNPKIGGELEALYIKNFYWEIMENEVAKLGIFNTTTKTPKESVQEARAFDVLNYINLNLAYNNN